MQFPDFQTHRTIIAREGEEDLEVVYLDNHSTTTSPPLLLLHGLFDNKATWRDLCAHLNDSCRIIAPDLIGFGHSSKPRLPGHPLSARYSTEMHVDYLSRFIDHLDLDDLILAGNSLGGGIALRLFLTSPSLRARIRGMILVNAAGYPQELPGYIREMGGWVGTLMNLSLFRALCFRIGIVSRMVRGTFHRTFFNPEKVSDDLVDEAIAVLQTPDIFYAYQMAARNIVPPDHESLVARFKEIDCPTLILWGREDRIIPPLFALRFKEDISNADLHIFDRCGHAPHIEYSEQTADLIENWLAKHFSGV